jgi:hypothetical protein
MDTPKPKPRQPNDPFYKAFVSQRLNPKVAKLTDAEFRAWHYALASARMMNPTGQWASRDYLDAALGEYKAHIDRLIEVDLLRVDDDGTLLSANWDVNQKGITDPTGAERQARWREREKSRNALRNADKTRLDKSRLDESRGDETRNGESSMDESFQSTEGVRAFGRSPLPRQSRPTPYELPPGELDDNPF